MTKRLAILALMLCATIARAIPDVVCGKIGELTNWTVGIDRVAQFGAGGAPPASTWTPSNVVDGLRGWLVADLSYGTNGAILNHWRDISTNELTPYKTIGSPIWSNDAVNGLAAIYFDGESKYEENIPIGSGAFEFWFVCKKDVNDAADSVIGYFDASDYFSQQGDASGAPAIYLAGPLAYYPGVRNEWQVCRIARDADGVLYAGKDGLSITGGTSSASVAVDNWGNYGLATGYNYKGLIAEMIVFTRYMDGTNAANVWNYLGDKYGL
jgi:hypothetical protein